MARIHYVIPDDLHRRAKVAAAQRGITLRQLVTDAIAASVADGRLDPKEG